MLAAGFGWVDVDIPLAHHMPPAVTQQRHVLTPAHGKMPMPGAALLLFSNGDIDPARQLVFDEAHELAQVTAGLIKIGDVLTIRQGQQVIGIGREYQAAQPGTRTPDCPVFVCDPVFG